MALFGNLILVLASLLASGADEENSKKILFIGKERDHPPATHEYLHECGMLAKMVRQTPGLQTVVSDGWPRDEKTLRGVDAIVLYTAMGGNVLNSKRAQKQAVGMLEQGVGLVAIHWSTGADEGDVGETYLQQLGGWFGFGFSKFLVRSSRMRRAAAEHPIARGWSDFDFRDEYYIDLKFLPQARPIAFAEVDGRDYPMAWVFERPDSKSGRSFGTVCGHFHDCFANESFRRLLVNAVLWSAHCEVPAEGAPCAIVAEDLVLPPDPRNP